MSMGTEPAAFDKDAIVVQAFLYTGRSVTDVHLKHLAKSVYDTFMAINSTPTRMTMVKGRMIDNGVVTISNNGVSYGLAFRDSGWYQDSSKRLVITAGQTYRLDVSAENKHAWAETTVPYPVGGIIASRETLLTYRFLPEGGETPIPPDSLTHMIVKWNNPNHALLYYRCFSDTNRSYPLPPGSSNYAMSDSIEIFSTTWPSKKDSTMNTFGLMDPDRYKIVIYTTTPDYQAMVKGESDSTQKDLWNNGPNNIHGGLGLFSSFGVDSVFFYIVPMGSVGNDGNIDSGNVGGGGK